MVVHQYVNIPKPRGKSDDRVDRMLLFLNLLLPHSLILAGYNLLYI